MDDIKKDPPPPPLAEEIARHENPVSPLRLDSLLASDPFVALLSTSDSVLESKGGIANLRIYTELLRDDQVSATWGQRRLALTACDTVVEPGAEDPLSQAAAEALQEEMDALPWDDITDKMLFAAFYGWGVAEVMWQPQGSRVRIAAVKVRDRARFRFDYDRGLNLWTAGSGWRQMPDRKFWTVAAGGDNHDQPYGLGLAHALYWPCFFKRNDIKFWLVFLEKFGMPTAMAKLGPSALADTPQGVSERANAITMLRQIATDAGVVVPRIGDTTESVVELLEAARSGSADYDGMHRAMNSAISKVVMGQTMTTDDGASLSQAQVHAGVAQKIVEADADLLCGSFNQGPVRWWTEWNFPGATPPRVYRQTEPPTDQAAQAERDTKIFALGFEPEDDYILKTYGPGWRRKSAPAIVPPGMLPAGPGQQLQQLQQTGQQFAEGEAAALAALKAARRADQQALLDAAVHFAEQYQTIMGRQVGAILQMAEDTNDPELFRERLNELLEQGPAAEQVDKLTRAGFFARMAGALRSQRRAN